MIINSPTNLANAVAPFAPVGRQPVGEESPESKDSRFKPVQNAAESTRSENRRGPDEHPNEVEERQRLSARGESDEHALTDEERQQQEAAEQQRQQQELEEIKQLAARDREVRAHEAAHAAVGGQYAGSPQYEFTRGPDGIRYAVAGEVSISTGKIPGDPEATLEKARQVRAAANAPADPSPQDRRVAAQAAAMEAEALAEIAENKRQETLEKAELRQQQEDQQKEDEAQKAQDRQQGDAEQTHSDAARQDDRIAFQQRSLDLNRRLMDIGAIANRQEAGSLLDQTV